MTANIQQSQQIEQDEEYDNDISFRPPEGFEASSSASGSSSSSETEQDSDDDSVPITKRPISLATRRAREETKTQALAKVDTVVPVRVRKPLLLDSHRPSRQPRPEAPDPDAQEEDQEEEVIATLDLESLNLQDKAILPEQLVKGEKIGSGGFKDV